MQTTPVTATASAAVADDLDTLRRALPTDGHLTPHLARFLAACAGTLHGQVGVSPARPSVEAAEASRSTSPVPRGEMS